MKKKTEPINPIPSIRMPQEVLDYRDHVCFVDTTFSHSRLHRRYRAMAIAGSLFLGLLLASISHPTNAFVTPSFARTSALRQLDSKLSPVPAARLPLSAPQLARSSFAPVASCATADGSQQGGRGALSMKVTRVGVIGAGRCAALPWYIVLCA